MNSLPLIKIDKIEDTGESLPERVNLYGACPLPQSLEDRGHIGLPIYLARRGNSMMYFRRKMVPYFGEMRRVCEKLEAGLSSNLSLGKATGYFLNNYEGLTRCLEDPEIPPDNNDRERELGDSVVGRKT